MGLGTDIKEVFSEVGIAYNILRSETISGEYLDWEPNSQVTKPFIREFFLECTFANDTKAVDGDVIQFMPSGEIYGGDKYLIMNKTPDIFENEILAFAGVLYKCNVSGELLRPSGEVWDRNYRKAPAFHIVSGEVHALFTEPLFGGELETEEELSLLGIEKQDLYVPTSYGVQPLDRFIPASGEVYLVESIKKRRFKGVDVAVLSEDTRL